MNKAKVCVLFSHLKWKHCKRKCVIIKMEACAVKTMQHVEIKVYKTVPT